LPDANRYDVQQERQRHIEALYRYGEYAMFVLMWNLRDFEKGLVARCSTCHGVSNSVQDRIADVYQQAQQDRCPNCLGTTFEGGWKAKIVRPSLWDFGEDVDAEGRRGITISAQASVQSTHDFQMHSGDGIMRGDGVRWVVQGISTHHIRVGYEVPLSTRNIIAFNFGNVVRANETDAIYDVEPKNSEDLIEMLDIHRPRTPVDFSSHDEFRAGAVLMDPYETPLGAS
jgi:hypothetical protein